MCIISSKHSVHVPNRPFKIPETFLLPLRRNVHPSSYPLIPFSANCCAREQRPVPKDRKNQFFLSLSLSKRIFDQRKKGKGEESNDDAAGARLGQNRKGLIYPCGGIALRGNRHVFTRVIPNRDRITAFRRASNLIATRALAASPKIHYMYPCSACSCPLEREGRNAAKGEEEEGKKNREREKKKEKRGGRREDENEGEKHSRIMPRCEMHGSPRIITSARPPRQES